MRSLVVGEDLGEGARPRLRSLSSKVAILASVATAFLLLAPSSSPAATPAPPPGPIPGLGELVKQVNDTVPSLTELALCATCLEFKFETVYRKADRTEVRVVHPAVFNVPAPLDVDGLPGAELVATLQGTTPEAATLAIVKSAPLAVPVSVQAVVTDPGSGATAGFGYDARGSKPTDVGGPTSPFTAPAAFTAALTRSPDDPTSVLTNRSVNIDLTTVAPGPTLALTSRTSESTHTVKAGIRYTPVPSSARIFFGEDETSLSPGSVSAVRKGKTLTLSTPQAVELTASIEDIRDTNLSLACASARQSICMEATAKNLPTLLTLRTEEDTSELTRDTTYTANSAVGALTINGTERLAGAVTQTANLSLSGVPTQVNVHQGQENRFVTVDTKNAAGQSTGKIDSIKAQLTNGPPRQLPAELASKGSYVHIFDKGTGPSNKAGSLLLLGLRSASLSHNGIVNLGADLAPIAPPSLGVLVEQATRLLRVNVSNLPNTVSFRFSPTERTIDYRGVFSNPATRVNELVLNATDSSANGLFPGAKRLDVRAQGVPADLEGTFGDRRVILDARGSTLDLLEARITSALDATTLADSIRQRIGLTPTGAQADGLDVRKLKNSSLKDIFDVVVRLTKFRKADVNQEFTPGPVDILLDTLGRKFFKYNVMKADSSKAFGHVLDLEQVQDSGGSEGDDHAQQDGPPGGATVGKSACKPPH